MQTIRLPTRSEMIEIQRRELQEKMMEHLTEINNTPTRRFIGEGSDPESEECARMTEVGTQINRLEGLADAFSERIKRLEGALSHVTRSEAEPVNPVHDTGDKEPYLVPLAHHLRNLANCYETQCGRIDSLLHRLEV